MTRSKKMGWLGTAFLVILLVVLPVVASCAPEAAPPPTPKARTIKVGFSAVITGPYGNVDMPAGMLDYFDYAKKNNLVPGVDLELMWTDSGGSLDRGLAFYKRAKEAGCMIVSMGTTGEAMALKGTTEADKIVQITQAVSSPVFVPPSWSFTINWTMEDNADAILRWVAKTWDKKEPPTVGALGWDNVVGRAPIPYFKKLVGELGFKLGPDLYFTMTATDFGSQLKALHDAGCDYVMVTHAGIQWPPMLKQCYERGFSKDMKFIHVFMLGSASQTPALLALPPEITEGHMTTQIFPTPFEDTPAARLISEFYTRYHGDDTRSKTGWVDYPMGLAVATVSCDALNQVLQKVSPQDITTEDIYKAVQNLKVLSREWVHAASFADYPGDRILAGGMKMVKFQGGKLVVISDLVRSQWRP